MSTQAALDELLVADREALTVQGELEQVWNDLETWLEDNAQLRRQTRGKIRRQDLGDAAGRLDLVRVRIGTAGGPERSRPPCPIDDPFGGVEGSAGLPAVRATQEMLEALAEIRRLRAWVRACHGQWAPGVEAPFGPLTDLETLQGRVFAAAQLVIPRFRTVRYVQFALLAVAVVAFVAFVVAT